MNISFLSTSKKEKKVVKTKNYIEHFQHYLIYKNSSINLEQFFLAIIQFVFL